MSDHEEGFDLTPEERAQAFEFWDALMFAVTPVELDAARLRLMGAPTLVQRAVMNSITRMWLKEYEPRREENPFVEEVQNNLGSEPGFIQEEMPQEHQEQSIYHECSSQKGAHTAQTAPALLPNVDWLSAPLDCRPALSV